MRRAIRVVIAGLACCAACLPSTGRHPLEATPLVDLMAQPDAQRLVPRPVETVGIVYPGALYSVFLVPVERRLPRHERVPLPDDCLQLLVTRDQFNALRTLHGRRIRLTGELYYAQRSSDTVLVTVKIRGRRASPYCQYDGPKIPIVYLESWRHD